MRHTSQSGLIPVASASKRNVCLWLLAALPIFSCERVVEVDREPPPPKSVGEEGTVQLNVVRGASGGTLAFVPVSINGEGPFAFGLDTGASHSVIDARVAEELRLPQSADAVEMTGISATPEAIPRRVEDWQIGQYRLPSQNLVSLDMAGSMSASGMQGLLGSDVLSRFDRVVVDYGRERLVLLPRRQQGPEKR